MLCVDHGFFVEYWVFLASDYMFGVRVSVFSSSFVFLCFCVFVCFVCFLWTQRAQLVKAEFKAKKEAASAAVRPAP